jgi:hypothetical protein
MFGSHVMVVVMSSGGASEAAVMSGLFDTGAD